MVLTLEGVCAAVGCPLTIRVDQRAEFVSCDLDRWACQNELRPRNAIGNKP